MTSIISQPVTFTLNNELNNKETKKINKEVQKELKQELVLKKKEEIKKI